MAILTTDLPQPQQLPWTLNPKLTEIIVALNSVTQAITDGTIGGTGGLDVEGIRDTIGNALVPGTNIAIVIDDLGNIITISTSATVNSTDAQLRARSSHTGTQLASTISDSTALGRSVLSAGDAAAARALLGAGTSVLALGLTASTAKAGDYAPTLADLPAGSTVTVAGATRTSTRTDLRYIFVNAADVPVVTSPSLAGMYNGDIQIKTA